MDKQNDGQTDRLPGRWTDRKSRNIGSGSRSGNGNGSFSGAAAQAGAVEAA